MNKKSFTWPRKMAAVTTRKVWLLLALIVALMAPSTVSAAGQHQDSLPGSELWAEPENLSRSGAAINPQLRLDLEGNAHLFWWDEIAGELNYVVRERQGWSAPIILPNFFVRLTDVDGNISQTATPLMNPNFQFGPGGRLHAFWTDSNSGLQHNYVVLADLATAEAWTEPEQIVAAIASYEAVVDDAGTLHVSYLRVAAFADEPAGLYYRHKPDLAANWSDAAVLQQSAYFRGLDPTLANIQLVALEDVVLPPDMPEEEDGEGEAEGSVAPTLGTGTLLVAWDNPALEQIFVARSADRGQSWSVALVAGRDEADDVAAPGPHQATLAVQADVVHLAWLEADATSCWQHQTSRDGGASWQSEAPVAASGAACPTDINFITGHDEFLFLLVTAGADYLLQAWNGSAWSAAEPQRQLTDLIDEVTFRPVTLTCLSTAVLNGADLLYVGCGTTTTKDIWLLERALGGREVWFPTAAMSPWSAPEQLFRSDAEVALPLLLTGDDDSIHAFWVENRQRGSIDASAIIYYSQWADNSWTRAVPLLRPGASTIAELSGIIAPDGTLFLLWQSSPDNTYSFSTVSQEQVLIPADWSVPQRLPSPHNVISKPQLYVGSAGTLDVIYANRLNEDRGIYLLRSADAGLSWMDPIAVFDAAAAGVPMVDAPQITQTTNGLFHVIWSNLDLRPEPVLTAIRYANSADGGYAWSEPRLLVPEGGVRANIFGLNGSILVATWEKADDDDRTLMTVISQDNGENWGPIQALSPLKPVSRHFQALSAGRNQVHNLFLAAADDQILVQEQSLYQSGWRDRLSSRFLSAGYTYEGADLAFAVSGEQMLLLTVANLMGQQGDPPQQELLYSLRSFSLPDGLAPAGPIAVLEPEPGSEAAAEAQTPIVEVETAGEEAAAEAEAVVNPTATSAAGESSPAPAASTQRSLITIVLAAVVPAALLIGFFFFWRANNNRFLPWPGRRN